MTQRVNLYLEDDFAEQIRRIKPRSLSLAAFCSWLIEAQLETLDTSTRVPAYCVGAGYSSNLQTKAQHENEADQASASYIQPPSKNFENLSPPIPVVLGDGIGMGLQGEGKRKVPFEVKKNIPHELEWCREPLLEFWREKGGKKSKQAAVFLFNQLISLMEKYGERVVLDQLELATAKGFDSITVRNYEQFGTEANKPAQKPQVDWDALDNVSWF